MKKILSRFFVLLLTILVALGAVGCGADEINGVIDLIDSVVNQTEVTDQVSEALQTSSPDTEATTLAEDGSYTSKDDVALYIHTYGHLPSNFITKSEARKLGWEGGSLEPFAPGCAIGGDRFGNYEGRLPASVSYRECDIGTAGASSRGARRLVYAEDCSAIYYTDDHYETFTLLYGEEEQP